MNITSILGTTPRTMLDYVGWLFKKENGVANLALLDFASKYHESEIDECTIEMITKTHEILSQPLQREWFEKPPEPKEENYLRLIWTGGMVQEPSHEEFDKDGFDHALNKHQNWQPLFKGEWGIRSINRIFLNGEDLGYSIDDFKSLDDFISFMAYEEKKEIEYHPEFEI